MINAFFLLFLFFWITPLHAQEIRTPTQTNGTAPWVTSTLETQFLELGKSQPKYLELLDEAVKKNKSKDRHDFFSQIKKCLLPGFEGGRVKTSLEQPYEMISRDLAGPDESDPDFKKYYTKRLSSQLAYLSTSEPESVFWDIQPDAVLVHQTINTAEICLREKNNQEEALDYLIHELVHFAKSKPATEVENMLNYADFNDYCTKTSMNVGDEVDAYIFEYEYKLKKEKPTLFNQYPKLSKLFSADGQFIGSKKELSDFIIVDLNYRSLRYKAEYHSKITNQISFEKDLIKLAESILTHRKDFLSQINSSADKRIKAINYIYPKYKKESQEIDDLLSKTKKSIQRLESELKIRNETIQKLETKLSILY